MIEYSRVAVFFIAGIYLHNRISASFALIFTISLIMVLTIKAIFKHKFAFKIFLPVTALVFGIILCQYAMCTSIRELAPYEGHYVTATGRISEIPEMSGENMRYVVDVKKIKLLEDAKIDEKILLTAPEGFEYGDTITFSGFLNTVPEKMNENGFDYAMYYKSKDIFFKIYSENVMYADMEIKDYSPHAIGVGVKNFISYIIENNYSGDYRAVLKAVLTGDKKEFSDEMDNALTATGTKRFFYPAFLHVMLFMSILTFVFGAVGKRKRDIIFVFLLILYTSVNFSNSVFLKLCVMLLLMLFLKRFFGYIYYPDILGMTALICGIINPLMYFNAGFVISMLSSIMMYYFFDYMNKRLKFIKNRRIRRTLAAGIMNTIGLIPVAAYFFNYVSLASILLSVLMLPCVLAILVLSPLLIIMLALFHTAPIVGQIVTTFTFVLKGIPILAEKIGFTGFSFHHNNILILLIHLLFVIAAVKHIKNKKKHERIALLTAAALMLSFGIREIGRLDDIEVTFVNVGQGDGAIISAPYKFNILIDGGGGNAYSDYNPGEKLYLDYLINKNITKVDSAFISHYHQDHVQGIIAAIENIRVKNLFMPDNMEGSEWRVALENAALRNGTEIHYISEETLLTYNNGMTLRIIPPSKKTELSDDENDSSYVYRIDYGGFSALFTGDMTSFAEGNLVDEGKIEHADLLKVSHHGSRTATSEEWTQAVSPQYAAISVGENNTYNLPNDEVLEILKNTRIFRTDYDGDIRFTAEKDGIINIETLNGR